MTYEEMLRHVRTNGKWRDQRAKLSDGSQPKALTVFAPGQIRYDLREGFPLITTKYLPLRLVAAELLFFIRGETNNRTLEDQGVTIWSEWQDENGNLGPIYGAQWRNWGGKPDNRHQPKPNCESPTVRGVASTKGYIKGKNHIDDLLRVVWSGMISRCYNKKKDSYKYYGGKGVYVCDRWLNLNNFLQDARGLDGWEFKINNWDWYNLDKDIYGDGFCYSPSTCKWASKVENLQMKYKYIHELVHESGKTAIVNNPVGFYKSHRISQGNFCSMLKGNRPTAGGWQCVKTTDTTKGIDQLRNLISDIQAVKKDPKASAARRLYVSAWNPSQIKLMSLPPCHVSFQCDVDGDLLNLQMYQRSADMFLGIPWNIASYALLTHILARITGLTPGVLTITLGNAHIYENHIEQVDEQLTRSIYRFPKLAINPDRKTLEDFENADPVYDFIASDYIHHPPLKGEVAV